MSDIRYVFVVEWFETAASLIRTYNLTYFANDKTIEMVTFRYDKHEIFIFTYIYLTV